ncbi:IS3 family transposase [Streptomyces sp. NBC_01205]|uniref:IS3 family transposase n=1 Tax=Streptomyces sp. NBC_01205 TaxID=2903771 RepID=UPI002E0FD5ED|nr:IS3 family transposase [Streptomyces sp. NBC_01205]
MPAPRKYPLELRERAVRMYRTAEPKPVIRRMAEDLGVHHEALRNWIRQAEADAGERGDLLTTAEREELAALRKENVQLKRANEVLRTASAFSRPSSTRPGPGDGARRRAPAPGVEPVLRELNIPSTTYYRWRQAETEPCERHRRDAELTSKIRQVHDESGGIYGSPRVHAVLKREGTRVGRKRVERLMRQAGLAGISPRRSKSFTRRDPDADLAPDLVQRDFTASGPNRLWVTDLTMITTLEGPLWLSAIRDAFSRRVVAWETSARADADLVLTTLEYALASREATPGELIHHADHGCQYTSVKLTTRLVRAGIQASMGSVGDSFDNALAENLWMLIKTEGVRGRTFATRAEANLALFEYIDGFYNPRRIQKRLGYLSPIEYEEKHYADQAAAEQVNLTPRQPALAS